MQATESACSGSSEAQTALVACGGLSGVQAILSACGGSSEAQVVLLACGENLLLSLASPLKKKSGNSAEKLNKGKQTQ